MSCVKNKYYLGFLKLHGPHRWVNLSVMPFMPYSSSFVVNQKCELCGCKQELRLLSMDDLLHMDLDIAFIESIEGATFPQPFPKSK